MKKLICLLLTIFMIMLLSACNITESIDSPTTTDNSQFIRVNKIDARTMFDYTDGGICEYIIYDKQTKVMYVCFIGQRRMTMSPLYNADGTLMIYDETSK